MRKEKRKCTPVRYNSPHFCVSHSIISVLFILHFHDCKRVVGSLVYCLENILKNLFECSSLGESHSLQHLQFILVGFHSECVFGEKADMKQPPYCVGCWKTCGKTCSCLLFIFHVNVAPPPLLIFYTFFFFCLTSNSCGFCFILHSFTTTKCSIELSKV